MQADWEFELGGDAAVIEAFWAGFVNLRRNPELAAELPEAVPLPALAAALRRLNSAGSPFWTSKCDYFPALLDGEFDRVELDALPEDSHHGVGCYIDLLPAGEQRWSGHETAGAECERICGRIRPIPLRGCRVDLVIRHASGLSEELGFGVTAYITACGPTPQYASCILTHALVVLADSVTTSA